MNLLAVSLLLYLVLSMSFPFKLFDKPAEPVESANTEIKEEVAKPTPSEQVSERTPTSTVEPTETIELPESTPTETVIEPPTDPAESIPTPQTDKPDSTFPTTVTKKNSGQLKADTSGHIDIIAKALGITGGVLVLCVLFIMFFKRKKTLRT